MSLTKVKRELLEEICREPGKLYTGSKLALAHKLQAEGLVEYRPETNRRGFQVSLLGRQQMKRGLTPELRAAVGERVKRLLHAHRDCLRNQKQDTNKITFNCQDGWYGEAFGMIRCLDTLGFGVLVTNIHTPKEDDLKEWFRELEQEVLKEENFEGSNECDFCLQTWGKDGAGRKKFPARL